ncbi:ADAMTS-like protein 1 [Malurus melanocephalus]|uniref:ADAMTS-like protein 1 n=1 Tax=Malurus melanocephalus TaxID=175006 RepID=UPI0025498BBF|nr:ADAMTS-like protein 1 [Malurus melanocephalus]
MDSFSVLNGSLFLRNVSYRDAGTYICRATNALGKAEAASVLHITEPRLTENNTQLLKGSRRKRVLMASGLGTNVTVVPGDTLRIGCPVLPRSRNAVQWLFGDSPIEGVEFLDYRSLAGGRVLEVNTSSAQFAGQFRCRTSASAKLMSVWVNVKEEGLLKII